ncbi:cellulose biosynthesis protein BcsE [Paraburkholderia caballeronis]|uniref:cellulose biosynthesis protein BcsE n=1 Tax=Paraburkholderia caballeronis TaxID=416943 RepID=UPI0010648915|nr:cellulose biosynthesis protein BcsE [Paraburkholderia caballeronis]TDV19436.1 cellulose biosynthesis protein BcsE [Paraburkholderia caballeronis]TDV22036.1 cellulose biosynthesis protein BcsE [Paraburkholderia caballeronis]TDV28940.1 cellulose biosynthesis protein BcsE [Paraburkholderia caballeronis]
MNAANRAPDRAPRPTLLGRMHARPSLVIEGLPPALAALSSGRVYVVYAGASPARDALFWKTAAAALKGPVNVLSSRDSGAIADLLRANGVDIDMPGAVHAKANICTVAPLPDRDGAEVLIEALNALAQQCAEPASEFLIEGPDTFFAWHDAKALARQGAQLASWCAQRGYGVLLTLAVPSPESGDAAAAPEPALTEFHARFAGAAQLLQESGQYTWEVAFWRGREAAAASSVVLPLRFSPDDYRLIVAGDTPGATATAGLLAPDENRVLVSRDAVVRERVIPAHWQVLDDNDAVVAAAEHAVAATVLLGYGGATQLEKLAEQVYTLRRRSGQALKIAVREDNVAMRYESVMRNLGVNLVIPLGTPISRVEGMIDDIQGQLFSRPLPADYMSALSAVLHSSEMGYVSTPRFIELVREAVDRARAIHLPNVLLRLPLLAEVAHVDALQACQMRRAGDLCTACGDSIYTFFFACRLAEVTTVFQRVFRLPAGDLFSGELRCGDYDSINAMLDTLEREMTDEPPLDYTSWLAQHRPADEPAAPIPADTATAPAPDTTEPFTTASAADVRNRTPSIKAPEPAETTTAAAQRKAEAAAAAAALRDATAPRALPKPASLPFKALG